MLSRGVDIVRLKFDAYLSVKFDVPPCLTIKEKKKPFADILTNFLIGLGLVKSIASFIATKTKKT